MMLVYSDSLAQWVELGPHQGHLYPVEQLFPSVHGQTHTEFACNMKLSVRSDEEED